MEEYTQITLTEWQEWKEDIRRKLQETAGNFVHIGYRLKQIRDSGMLDGAADIFEFAQREYGLGKSTVSRFIAINERFSEGGYSLEMKPEYRGIGSSKLSEMLTLTDAECRLITERTTVREIRELKQFGRQQEPERAEGATETERTYSPLQKCIIDFFSDQKRKQALDETMKLMEQEAEKDEAKKAMEQINPGGYASHKKGIVFLFLYDWNTGVKYKLMTNPEPVSMSWIAFLTEVMEIYQDFVGEGGSIWERFYGKKEPEKQEEKTKETQENQGFQGGVATSQQEEKREKNEEENEQKKTEEKGSGAAVGVPERKNNSDLPETEADSGSEGGVCQETRDLSEGAQTGSTTGEQDSPACSGEADGESGSGFDSAEPGEQPEPGSEEDHEPIDAMEQALREEAEDLAEGVRDVFWGWDGQELPMPELLKAEKNAKKLSAVIAELVRMKSQGQQLEEQISIEDVLNE